MRTFPLGMTTGMKWRDIRETILPLYLWKAIKLRGNFLKHAKHCDNISLAVTEDSSAEESTKPDELFHQASVFMKLALLHRDMYDAYIYGDGLRVMLDAKLALLYFHKCGHTKYALWAWIMLAFSKDVLSPRHSLAYIWNICTNTEGLGKTPQMTI